MKTFEEKTQAGVLRGGVNWGSWAGTGLARGAPPMRAHKCRMKAAFLHGSRHGSRRDRGMLAVGGSRNCSGSRRGSRRDGRTHSSGLEVAMLGHVRCLRYGVDACVHKRGEAHG